MAKVPAVSGFAFGNGQTAMARSVQDTAALGIVEFEAQAGVVYGIQWTPALCTEWTTLRRWTAETDGEAALEVELPAGAPAGFFRVTAADTDDGTE